jgi:hypothetical protein
MSMHSKRLRQFQQQLCSQQAMTKDYNNTAVLHRKFVVLMLLYVLPTVTHSRC